MYGESSNYRRFPHAPGIDAAGLVEKVIVKSSRSEKRFYYWLPIRNVNI